jgi:hypothetical protein
MHAYIPDRVSIMVSIEVGSCSYVYAVEYAGFSLC